MRAPGFARRGDACRLHGSLRRPGVRGGQYHFAAKWGTLGSGDGQFNHPGGVETDAAGRLLGLPAVVYVADSYNNRIQKFTANGSLITKWGTAGSGEGQFSRPWDVATDLAGNVYVADG